MSVQGFINYMTSREGDGINPAEMEQRMTMREPLSHYFINSSHNTYLTGRHARLDLLVFWECQK